MELNRLFEFSEQVYRKADVGAVFGEPQTVGHKTIIPVGRVCYGLGLGFGKGEGPRQDEGATDSTGSGGGGGGGGMAGPIAVIEVTDEETKVIPVVDPTTLALAGMFLAAWNLFWIARTIRVLKRCSAQG